jgi:hypothetical protein
MLTARRHLMNDRIAKLKTRVRALHRGLIASQVRYPEDLR